MAETSHPFHTFCARWFPITLSFAQLFLGNDREGMRAAVEAFSEYARTGLPFETDEMPLLLWSCAVESVLERAGDCRASRTTQSWSAFDTAIMRLGSDERLAFLLLTVYGLDACLIELITGWPLEEAAALNEAACFRIRKGLDVGSPQRIETGTSA